MSFSMRRIILCSLFFLFGAMLLLFIFYLFVLLQLNEPVNEGSKAQQFEESEQELEVE
jgi:hypothetical protein